MDIAIEQQDWRQRTAPEGADDAGRLDWHGLRARLLATHAARQALSQAQAGAGSPGGSFDRAAARLIAAYEPTLAGVNRDASALGKSDGDKDAPLAGPSTPGGRG